MYEMRRQVCFRSEGAEPEWRVHQGDVRALEITSRSSMKGKTGRANPRGQHGVLYEKSESGKRTDLSDATVSDADSFDGLHPSLGYRKGVGCFGVHRIDPSQPSDRCNTNSTQPLGRPLCSHFEAYGVLQLASAQGRAHSRSQVRQRDWSLGWAWLSVGGDEREEAGVVLRSRRGERLGTR